MAYYAETFKIQSIHDEYLDAKKRKCKEVEFTYKRSEQIVFTNVSFELYIQKWTNNYLIYF